MADIKFSKNCYLMLQVLGPHEYGALREAIKIGMERDHFLAQRRMTEGPVGVALIMTAYDYLSERRKKRERRGGSKKEITRTQKQ